VVAITNLQFNSRVKRRRSIASGASICKNYIALRYVGTNASVARLACVVVDADNVNKALDFR
jgi:hypothetical protein